LRHEVVYDSGTRCRRLRVGQLVSLASWTKASNCPLVTCSHAEAWRPMPCLAPVYLSSAWVASMAQLIGPLQTNNVFVEIRQLAKQVTLGASSVGRLADGVLLVQLLLFCFAWLVWPQADACFQQALALAWQRSLPSWPRHPQRGRARSLPIAGTFPRPCTPRQACGTASAR
jgi:hypothetical protein